MEGSLREGEFGDNLSNLKTNTGLRKIDRFIFRERKSEFIKFVIFVRKSREPSSRRNGKVLLSGKVERTSLTLCSWFPTNN